MPSEKKGKSGKPRELTASVKRPVRKTESTSSGGSRAERSKQTEKKKKPRYEHADEIAGVIFIAVGIVFGILTYVKTTAVLGSVVTFLFGLIGVVQYAMPVVLVVIGVILIAVPKKQFGTGAVVMMLLTVWSVSCIIHILTFKVGSSSFKEYITSAYDLGKAGRGGGFLASIPAFGAAKLVSTAGAVVVFAAAAIILLLLVTRVSIRSAGKKVIAKVDAIEDRRKARLINEKVGEEQNGDGKEESAIKRSRRERAEEARRLEKERQKFKEEDELKLSPVNERKGLFGKHKKAQTLKPERSDIGAVIEGVEGDPVVAGQLNVMPKSGTIPNEIPASPAKGPEVSPVLNAPPAVDNTPADFDPFEDIEIVPEDNITGETPEQEPAAHRKDVPVKAETEAGEIAEPAPVRVYQRPPISLLTRPDRTDSIANDSPSEKAKLLIETLASFNITAKVINISVGPVITRFEVQPAQGVRVNRITALSNDIALALAAPRVRIEAPIPGKAAIGIEIPNKATAMVRLREVLDTNEFSSASSPLTFALGKDIAGKPVMADLEKMPHMLIAGATGSGKSVCINGIILSTVYKSSPDEVRMILIDPKVVELSIFAPVPHLYCPVVTDPKKAAGVLKWACNEMDQRYIKMSKVNARDLKRYNILQDDPANRMPRLVIIIDELADLMIVSAKDVEESIARLAQLGRACGIHLIVATQRPSVDVITGLIKTNIPSRIAFAVSSATDSRVILDMGGAEKLLGHGDMLFHPNGAAKPIRAQGAYVSDEEVENIMQFFVENQIDVPQDDRVLSSIPDLTAPTGQGNGKQEDDLLPDAVRIVMESGSASISMIQRRLRVGYARAARLVDIMEQHKFVSGFDGSKPRKVLIDEAGYAEFFGSGSGSESDE
ncbi:MAG: DNA translocase FtsK [Clostridiales bacterium]|nr:DNA translocase FtsK [Clostridiales bacterium]